VCGWRALQPRQPWRLPQTRKRQVLMLLIPVRQSVLAPAEVVPLGVRAVVGDAGGERAVYRR